MRSSLVTDNVGRATLPRIDRRIHRRRRSSKTVRGKILGSRSHSRKQMERASIDAKMRIGTPQHPRMSHFSAPAVRKGIHVNAANCTTLSVGRTSSQGKYPRGEEEETRGGGSFPRKHNRASSSASNVLRETLLLLLLLLLHPVRLL